MTVGNDVLLYLLGIDCLNNDISYFFFLVKESTYEVIFSDKLIAIKDKNKIESF